MKLKGIESDSEGETLSTLFYLPSEKGSTLNGKNLLPFSVVLCMEESKQKVTKVVSYVKIVWKKKKKNLPSVSSHITRLFNLTLKTWSLPILGLIVYKQAIVHIHQNFLKVVVHMIIIDQWSQTVHLYKIQVTIIYSCTTLVYVTSELASECCVKRVSWKPGLEY